MNEQHEQEVRDAQSQNNVAAIFGILVVVGGLITAVIGDTLIGILIAILGLLIYMAMSINAGIAQISLNQCVIIELQNAIVRSVRENKK